MTLNHMEITRKAFQTVIDGKQVDLYTLRNGHGMVARITNQGGKIVQLLVPDRNNRLGDVVLGYDTIDRTMAGRGAMGALVGRYANRIAEGRFILNGQQYQLPRNDGRNHLHGGKGLHFLVLDAKQIAGRTLQLNYYFKDGEEGYPGNVSLKVVYSVNEDNELAISYDAVTDKPTVVNFTNHAFFNLAGAGEGNILDHELTINADRFTVVDGSTIPTGELRDVKGTPMDFTSPERIGARIHGTYEQLKLKGGYDHNYVLNKTGDAMSFAARLHDPSSGRVMEVYTTEPGVQFYSGNNLTGEAGDPRDVGKSGKFHAVWGGVCLETQHFPDSPNHSNFPTTVLNPGQWFTSTTIFKFSPKFSAEGNSPSHSE